MSGIQQEILNGLQYMQNCVEEGRYGNLEDADEQAAFEEDLNEVVLDKFED